MDINLKSHIRKKKKMRCLMTIFPGLSNGSELQINGKTRCNYTFRTPLSCIDLHISIPKRWFTATVISESRSYISSCFILLHTAEEKREYFGPFSLPFAKVSILKRYYSLIQKRGYFSAVFIKWYHWKPNTA